MNDTTNHYFTVSQGHLEEEVNNRGRTIRTLNSIPPVPGQDIYLTIDLDLQKKAMELLDGRRGTIVAIDPRDGGVLAMASSPSYDPKPICSWYLQQSLPSITQ